MPDKSLRERQLQWNFVRFCPSTLRQEESVKKKVACKRSLSFIFAVTIILKLEDGLLNIYFGVYFSTDCLFR